MSRRLLPLLALGLLVPASAAARVHAPIGLTANSRPATAAGGVEAPLALSADSGRRGFIRLIVRGVTGARVVIREGDRIVGLLTLSGVTGVLPRAGRWTCTRDRTFTATDGTVTATAAYRTPSCRGRLSLSGPRALRAGRVARFVVRDTWGLGGFGARLCVRSPRRSTGCRPVRPGTRGQVVARRFWRAGPWRLTVRAPQGAGRARVLRVRRIAHLRVLAAGDSMIEIVDDLLRGRLAPSGGGVRFDDHISTGLSKPFLLDWPRHAAAVSRSYRPDVTVMFVGANDGFPFGSVGCCRPAWVRAYAARARTMMRSYVRGGTGRVYWLTLPTPRGGAFRRVFPAVNRAVRRAARGLGDVRVVETGPSISPGGVFRPGVRQADGVHLNVRGAARVANLVVRALRADGVL